MSVQQTIGAPAAAPAEDRYLELRGIPLVVIERASSQAGLASFVGCLHPTVKRT